jgi:hypothetical protein
MLPVNYAAKITGTQNNWNIGLMHISDERDYGNSQLSVGRISRNLGKQSKIGVIGTWGNALSSAENLVGGMDLKLATSRFQKNKNLAFTLFGLISDTPGKKDNNTSWGADIGSLRGGRKLCGRNRICATHRSESLLRKYIDGTTTE